jgi:hypothetical protein
MFSSNRQTSRDVKCLSVVAKANVFSRELKILQEV